MKVLVVCSGNLCRSPMAAEYLRARAPRAGLSHVVVASAGTLGLVGAPAPDEAVAACDEIGVDLRGHRSRALTSGDLRTTDVILAMTDDHLRHCGRIAPDFRGEAWLLRAFERSADPIADPPDLDDPVGLPLSAFRETLAVIRVCVDHFVIRLRHAP